jgi:competence protein ComFC
MSFPKFVLQIGQALLEILMPGDCPGCGKPVEGGPFRRVCELCAGNIDWICRPFCDRCGLPSTGADMVSRHCPNCRDLQPSFGKGRALFLSTGVGRSFIHDVKYHGDRSLLCDLPALMQHSPEFINHLKNAVLVPVPLHRLRLCQRGYNQSVWIAEAFSACFDIPLRVEQILVRNRNTRTQTRLSREARLTNVKNAFALKPRTRLDKRTRYVVVDDVFTTGSTLDACAGVLLEAGLEQVDVAALGHG